MELKVWVEGIQRIVCGVSETTTCQEVVFALAHATGRTGRFTLTERWRNNERLLAPHEHPLEVLLKWGEYSNDVQFILQHSASNSGNNNLTHTPPSASYSSNLTNWFNADQNKDARKSLTFSPHHRTENIGIVKGVPKQAFSPDTKSRSQSPTKSVEDDKISTSSSASTKASLKYKEDDIQRHTAVGNEGMNTSKRKVPPSYREPPDPNIPYIRVLPPYREPPPPCSNASKIACRHVSSSDTKITLTPVRYSKLDEFQNNCEPANSSTRAPEYRDLIYLINQQRDKLFAQQAELNKYDAEIMYWETKTREQQYQMEMLSQDAVRVDSTLKEVDEQLSSMGTVEEEMEIVKQQDRTLKSELTLLRSKLANCETELLLCKKKIRLLLEDIKTEQRILAKESDERNHIERSTIAEVDRLQLEVDQAKHEAEVAAKIGDTLNKEVAILETAINEKKRQVEKLVTDMKEANLQSLAASQPEELKIVLEGAPFFKTGSTRKMIGSPRQLENAVPTSKNPHGIWV